MRRLLSAGLVAFAGSFPTVAQAGNGSDDAPAVVPPPAPASFAVEVRFGPYRPQLTPGGVFDGVYGDGRRFMIATEVDWQAMHVPHVGSLGIGGIIGYTRASAFMSYDNPARGASGEETYFRMWAFAVAGVARIDVLARDLDIPLVPYGKLGTWVALWNTGNGLGTSVSADGREGKGRTHGVLWAAGLALELDFLDRSASKSFLVEHGVDHTWLFGEYTGWDLSGLGQTDFAKVGDRTWTFGLGFQM